MLVAAADCALEANAPLGTVPPLVFAVAAWIADALSFVILLFDILNRPLLIILRKACGRNHSNPSFPISNYSNFTRDWTDRNVSRDRNMLFNPAWIWSQVFGKSKSGVFADMAHLFKGSSVQQNRAANIKNKVKRGDVKNDSMFAAIRSRLDPSNELAMVLDNQLDVIQSNCVQAEMGSPFGFSIGYPESIRKKIIDLFYIPPGIDTLFIGREPNDADNPLVKIHDMWSFHLEFQCYGTPLFDQIQNKLYIEESGQPPIPFVQHIASNRSPEQMLDLMEFTATKHLITLLHMYNNIFENIYIIDDMLFSEKTATEEFLTSITKLIGIRNDTLPAILETTPEMVRKWFTENKSFGKKKAEVLADYLKLDKELKRKNIRIDQSITMTGWRLMRICSWIRNRYPITIAKLKKERTQNELAT